LASMSVNALPIPNIDAIVFVLSVKDTKLTTFA
jgi:hypothetical protein